MNRIFVTAFPVLFIGQLFVTVFPGSIILERHDAVVWQRTQMISGKLDSMIASSGILYINERHLPIDIQQDSLNFSRLVELEYGKNLIWVNVADVWSDTLVLTLGFLPRPDVYAYSVIGGRQVQLRAMLIDNAGYSTLEYHWEQDPGNPATVVIENAGLPDAVTSIPADAPTGEYYFDLTVTFDMDLQTRFRTLVSAEPESIRAFDIGTDHAEWIDSAIIYQITPYNLFPSGTFQDIIDRLNEFKGFGVNTLYLQPVYKTHFRGQGYDITDYFSVRSDYGTEDELHTLVSRAKELGFRVVFDFVPGHTSLYHPYMQHAIEFGETSHYYTYYKREFDNAPYSMHYHRHPEGFLYYFWEDLPMLDYDHPEVRRWIIEASLFWIREYNIDGYRIDAVWGIHGRNPDFLRDWRLAVKRIKPEFLFLAEDKASWYSSFDQKYDAAYDWKPEESWVSHWSWQTNYSTTNNYTIFNSLPENHRSAALRNALTNDGNGFHPQAKILHFMENNDTFRFIQHHGTQRAKMAAALLFTLPGIPMMYNGQEIGHASHPYETYNVFTRTKPIADQDQLGLYPYYQKLIDIRKGHPSLNNDRFTEIVILEDPSVYGFYRQSGNDRILSVINMADEEKTVAIILPVDSLGMEDDKIYFLTDLLDRTTRSGMKTELDTVEFEFTPYQARILFLSDTLWIDGIMVQNAVASPEQFYVEQNYPNPFNSRTRIIYRIPEKGRVIISLYNILGRHIATLQDEYKPAGVHTFNFQAGNIASGLYFYRISSGNRSTIRKMVYLK